MQCNKSHLKFTQIFKHEQVSCYKNIFCSILFSSTKTCKFSMLLAHFPCMWNSTDRKTHMKNSIHDRLFAVHGNPYTEKLTWKGYYRHALPWLFGVWLFSARTHTILRTWQTGHKVLVYTELTSYFCYIYIFKNHFEICTNIYC